MKLQIALTAFVVTLTASAAVPVRWTVETSRVQPAQIEAYHGETLRDALYAAREAAVWNFNPYYCFVGTNDGSQQFNNWGGLWYANSAGASDNYMYQISPEDGYEWGLYELASKSFSVPVWCRDFATSFEPYQNFTSKGEIESWIGAFDWAFKAITHN